MNTPLNKFSRKLTENEDQPGEYQEQENDSPGNLTPEENQNDESEGKKVNMNVPLEPIEQPENEEKGMKIKTLEDENPLKADPEEIDIKKLLKMKG